MEKRGIHRFAYVHPMSYAKMGRHGRLPAPSASVGQIVNVSNMGMQMLVGETPLETGAVIQAQIPMAGTPVTLPVLSEVRWVKEITPGRWHAGFLFLLGKG